MSVHSPMSVHHSSCRKLYLSGDHFEAMFSLNQTEQASR